ncbi:MAG: hypothetical protein OEM19_06635 [Deltaproteobacteria bacterium]|nr:hypothetical protein [Deltaproteobacteria bacterium]
MEMKKKICICFLQIVIFASLIVGLTIDKSPAAYIIASNGGDIQGQGVYIDITIEDVSVQAFEVSRGEKVIFTVTLKNRGEITEDYITLRLYSGKRLLTEKVVFPDRWDVKDMAKFDFLWDTKDVAPGSYPVLVEAFMFSDQDAWDNRYEIPQKILVR